jgi:hypothetical protein
MKKIKIAFWLIIVGFLGLLIYQNRLYLLATHSLTFEIPFTEKFYQLAQIPNGIFFVICLLIGFLVAYFLSLLSRFKDSRTIKSQKATIKSYTDTVSALKKEVESIKNNTGKEEAEGADLQI